MVCVRLTPPPVPIRHRHSPNAFRLWCNDLKMNTMQNSIFSLNQLESFTRLTDTKQNKTKIRSFSISLDQQTRNSTRSILLHRFYYCKNCKKLLFFYSSTTNQNQTTTTHQRISLNCNSMWMPSLVFVTLRTVSTPPNIVALFSTIVTDWIYCVPLDL